RSTYSNNDTSTRKNSRRRVHLRSDSVLLSTTLPITQSLSSNAELSTIDRQLLDLFAWPGTTGNPGSVELLGLVASLMRTSSKAGAAVQCIARRTNHSD